MEMLYVCRTNDGMILSVYASGQDAMDAASGRISAGNGVEIICAEDAPGSDWPSGGGPVWIYTARGGVAMTAFSDMDAAEARRLALGGTVRGFQISVGTGGGTREMDYDDSQMQSYAGGKGMALRKSASDLEFIKRLALGSPQDYPSDENDPATRAAAYLTGFARQINKAFSSPKTMGARL